MRAPSGRCAGAENCIFLAHMMRFLLAFSATAAAAALALAGCATPLAHDAPRLRYVCPHGLAFEARLYQDMARLDGLSGQVALERVGADGGALSYADETVHAIFGLGEDGRLARLRYTGIPQEVTCWRQPQQEAEAASAPVRAWQRPGPRAPEHAQRKERATQTWGTASGATTNIRTRQATDGSRL